MLIDLRKIPTRIIACPDKGTTRYKDVTAMAQRVGLHYEVYQSVYMGSKTLGCALAHLRALKDAPAPCLVLEDDCEETPHFRHRFEVPDEADVVSLAINTAGIPLSEHPSPRLTLNPPSPRLHETRKIPRYVFGGAVATEYNETFLRIHNMLGGTAYLYITEKAIKETCEAIVDYMTILSDWDNAMARLQKQRLLVLTPRRPFLYQKYDKDQTYRETGLTPVPNLEKLDDAWFEHRMNTQPPPIKNAHPHRGLFRRIITSVLYRLWRALERLLKKSL